MLTKKVHPKIILMIGGLLGVSGAFISSFTKQFWVFASLYGGLSGIGTGMSYMIPMVVGWEHYPDRKGMVTGIIVGSFGFGSFIYVNIATKLMNPNNEEATIYINEDLSLFDS
mmetsp:Transcript_4692/g.7994  ORF Transcript_4692/g.7994 Transcript_4692/m.7994 type:complete len:113 (+) Transcript_4692:147-485(+)